MDDLIHVFKEFTLPVGIIRAGKMIKKGRIRLITNRDILEMNQEINDDPEIKAIADEDIILQDGKISFGKALMSLKLNVMMATITLPKLVELDDEPLTKDDILNMSSVDTQFLMDLKEKMDEESGEKKSESDRPFQSESS